MSLSVNNMYSTLSSDTMDSLQKSDSLQNNLKSINKDDSTDEELMSTCKQFESYFVEQVMKEMKKTVHTDEDDGEYVKYFGDMMTEQYASNAVDSQSFGIAKMLYDSMKNNTNSSDNK